MLTITISVIKTKWNSIKIQSMEKMSDTETKYDTVPSGISMINHIHNRSINKKRDFELHDVLTKKELGQFQFCKKPDIETSQLEAISKRQLKLGNPFITVRVPLEQNIKKVNAFRYTLVSFVNKNILEHDLPLENNDSENFRILLHYGDGQKIFIESHQNQYKHLDFTYNNNNNLGFTHEEYTEINEETVFFSSKNGGMVFHRQDHKFYRLILKGDDAFNNLDYNETSFVDLSFLPKKESYNYRDFNLFNCNDEDITEDTEQKYKVLIECGKYLMCVKEDNSVEIKTDLLNPIKQDVSYKLINQYIYDDIKPLFSVKLKNSYKLSKINGKYQLFQLTDKYNKPLNTKNCTTLSIDEYGYKLITNEYNDMYFLKDDDETSENILQMAVSQNDPIKKVYRILVNGMGDHEKIINQSTEIPCLTTDFGYYIDKVKRNHIEARVITINGEEYYLLHKDKCFFQAESITDKIESKEQKYEIQKIIHEQYISMDKIAQEIADYIDQIIGDSYCISIDEQGNIVENHNELLWDHSSYNVTLNDVVKEYKDKINSYQKKMKIFLGINGYCYNHLNEITDDANNKKVYMLASKLMSFSFEIDGQICAESNSIIKYFDYYDDILHSYLNGETPEIKTLDDFCEQMLNFITLTGEIKEMCINIYSHILQYIDNNSIKAIKEVDKFFKYSIYNKKTESICNMQLPVKKISKIEVNTRKFESFKEENEKNIEQSQELVKVNLKYLLNKRFIPKGRKILKNIDNSELNQYFKDCNTILKKYKKIINNTPRPKHHKLYMKFFSKLKESLTNGLYINIKNKMLLLFASSFDKLQDPLIPKDKEETKMNNKFSKRKHSA